MILVVVNEVKIRKGMRLLKVYEKEDMIVLRLIFWLFCVEVKISRV